MNARTWFQEVTLVPEKGIHAVLVSTWLSSVMQEVPQMQIDESWKVMPLKWYYPMLTCCYRLFISICFWSPSDWGCWARRNLNQSLLAEEIYGFSLYKMLTSEKLLITVSNIFFLIILLLRNPNATS